MAFDQILLEIVIVMVEFFLVNLRKSAALQILNDQ